MRTLALAAFALLAAALFLPDIAFVASADGTITSSAPKALFLSLSNNRFAAPQAAPGTVSPQLVQWNGQFTDNTMQNITYTMVGTDPSRTNTTTVVAVVIIPIKMVFGPNNGNATFDPLAVKLPNGRTLLQNVLLSPLFTNSVTFIQGGTNVGKTQYIDAFQRANFWSPVSTNTKYHVILGNPTILPEQTIVVPVQDGNVQANPFGGTGGNPNVGTMYVNDFDTAVQGFIAHFVSTKQLNPHILPLFITYDTYLTEVPLEVCCIGGYHSANGSQPNGQTYAYTTYVDRQGVFSQDVSAMSHELGEWMDDPFVDNSVNCLDNQLLEVGDPLENNANSGAFPYTSNGFTYNLQSLVFLDYFGAPRITDLQGWFSFQNDEPGPCPGQNVSVTASAPPLGLSARGP